MNRITLLFFGPLRDVTGAPQIAWDVAPGATLADLLAAVGELWPQLLAWRDTLLWAIDLRYASLAETIPMGAEVALMPPVQGG
jgi:molybdopterin synthase sulfur carrier subunit